MFKPIIHAHNDAIMQVVADSIVDTELGNYVVVLSVH